MDLSRATGRHFSRCGPAPSLSSGALRVGHRYATQEGEVREIVSFDGGLVVYVVGRGAIFPVWDKRQWHFPVWDKRQWHLVIRPVFLSQVVREVRHCI
jgi:hypothetical protein